MGYISKDKFNLDGDTTYAYSNKNANIKWKHNFSNTSYAVFTAGIDHYQYSVSSTKVPVNAYKLSFDINQLYLQHHIPARFKTIIGNHNHAVCSIKHNMQRLTSFAQPV